MDGVTWHWRDHCIHTAFEFQAELRPDAVALRFAGTTMTYAELDRATNQLALELRAAGVGPGATVGVYVRRSLELVIAMLGVLKAGGAYVALDPADPLERLSYLIGDASAQKVITHESLAHRLPAGIEDVRLLDRQWLDMAARAAAGRIPNSVSPDGLAYVCYTSGSTGRPKGVCATHRGVVRLVVDGGYHDFDHHDTFLQLTPPSFDASVLDLWVPLLNGACLVIHPPTPPVFDELGTLFARERISVVFLPTGLFHRLAGTRPDVLRPVRHLLVGGERLSAEAVNQALEAAPGLRITNGYGPTENTTITCTYTTTVPVPGDWVPIGRPVNGTRVFVLDPDLRPMPTGQTGELYVAGDGVARGYLRQPDLTSQRFAPLPSVTGDDSLVYRTGDLVVRRADGELEFQGRLDDQVKIRGHRVEPGEVTATLLEDPSVRDAVVMARANAANEPQLVAYVVPQRRSDTTIAELRRRLHERLPSYLVPPVIVLLGELPLNRNGKVDRAALPLPTRTARGIDSPYVPPDTRAEALLAELVADVLNLDTVGVEDEFFALGGDSLTVIDLAAEIRTAFGVRMSERRVFEPWTVGELAAVIERQEKEDPP